MKAIRLSWRKQFGYSSEELGKEGYEQRRSLVNEEEAWQAAEERAQATLLLSGMGAAKRLLPECAPAEYQTPPSENTDRRE